MTVLGTSVVNEQVERWLGYYCPGPQPFRTVDLTHDAAQSIPTTDAIAITDEVRDTLNRHVHL